MKIPSKFLYVFYYRPDDKSLRVWNNGELIAELNKNKQSFSNETLIIHCQAWLYEHNKRHVEYKVYIEIM